MARVCLNMIVKNESAIIERCLASVAPFVDCYVIADTGSTDDTKEKIKTFFAERGIEGQIVEFPFENFEQARNAAIQAAEDSEFFFDFLLLTDADMELVVGDPSVKDGLTANAYLVKQRAGAGLAYDNARLLKRGVGGRYFGVTHEYLNVEGEIARFPESVIRFIDHACGSNRADKAERDIRLLLAGLEDDPENGRYHFYLAQTYFEQGRYEDSLAHYIKRQQIEGFDEEVWFSQMAEALCEAKLGRIDAFENKMLRAFQSRPSRSEPLYRLAQHYLRTEQYALCALICEEGLTIPVPDDLLFVETAVYERGFKELFAISGFYVPTKKGRAFDMNNWLALTRKVPKQSSTIALINMPPYLAPLSIYLDSWEAKRIDFQPEDGWFAMNPSVARVSGYLDCIVRTVNYEVQFGETAAAYVTPEGAPITTRNFYLRLADDLTVLDAHEIAPPVGLPAPEYDQILGFEDLRLVDWHGEAYVNGTCCELEEGGWRNMTRARVNRNEWRLEELAVLLPDTAPRQAEKNWAPFVKNGELRYLYSYGPTKVVDAEAETLTVSEPAIRATSFRGGSQLVPFDDGWLCVVHEVAPVAQTHNRIYFHRFVFFDGDMNIKRVSIPFVFQKPRFEFCAGLAWAKDGKRLILSFGVDDREAWIGTVLASEVEEFLLDASAF
jgi:glycosyltransferase involved in cell wall biosynthesis